MKTFLLSILMVAMCAIAPMDSEANNVAWGISGNSHGGFAIGVRSTPNYHHGPYGGSRYYGGGYSRRVVRTRTVVRGGGYYGGGHPVHLPAYPVYQSHYQSHHNPYGYVHRQQGRVYYQESYGREVIVVPRGGGRVHYGY